MIEKYDNYIQNHINESEYNGKYGFFLFLEIIDLMKNSFIKENYLNTTDFNLFFTTDKIMDLKKLELNLEFKKSLNVAYSTIKHIKNLRLSFYFGVRDYELHYGFHDDLKRMIYTTGKFKISSSFLNSISSYKCISLISNILKEIKLKDLKTLSKCKSDMYSIDNNQENMNIIDSKRLIKTIKKSNIKIPQGDIRNYFDSWCFKFNWYYSVYNYIDEDQDNYIFYIKIKEIDDNLNMIKRHTDIKKLSENVDVPTPEPKDKVPVVRDKMLTEPLKAPKLSSRKFKKKNTNSKSKVKTGKEKKEEEKRELIKYYKDLERVIKKILKDQEKNKSYVTQHVYSLIGKYNIPFAKAKNDLIWLHNKLKEDSDFINKMENKN